MKIRQDVLIQTVASCTDLQVIGSNLDTGKKAHFHVKGKNQGYKIYMTNTGKSISCYIKLKGVNHELLCDHIIYNMTPYSLVNYVDWYIELSK